MSKRKRPPGEGTITKRKDGRYEAARTVGYNEQGNPVRIRSYGRSQGEARQKLEKKIQDYGGPLKLGGIAEASKVTVEDWLESWLRFKETTAGLKPRTIAGYRHMAEKHIVPSLGRRKLLSLKLAHVEDLLTRLAGRGLARSTIRQVWQVLNNACRHAVRRELLASNPCAEAQKPGRETDNRPKAWTPVEASMFLAAAIEESKFYPLYFLALTTGLRRGELLGLELHKDLDLDEGTLRVRQTQSHRSTDDVTSAKTDRSRRKIPLAPDAVTVLREHLERRAELAAGERWRDSGRLFTMDHGGPISSRYLYGDFKAVIKGCNTGEDGKAIDPPPVRDITFHALRHTYATWALRQLPVHVVSKRLGHRDAAITMRIYAHVLADMEQEGALTLAALMEPRLKEQAERNLNVN